MIMIDKTEINNEVRQRAISWAGMSLLGLVGYGVIVFFSAGRLDWFWGWVFVAGISAVLIAQPLILIHTDPELFIERSKGLRGEDVKQWDKLIAPLAAGVFPMIAWVVAGLTLRFGWSGMMSLGLHIAGLLGFALGMGLFLWAMASNAFFAESVRIQTERGHSVSSNGPYRVVRHPGYVGAIIGQLATPFLLGSWWALIPSCQPSGHRLIANIGTFKTSFKVH
jgi:hypothetical protein